MSHVDLLFSGDLILDVPQPEYWLDGIAPLLRRAALAIGHLEVPHTRRAAQLHSDIAAPGADPAHVPAMRRAGFHAVSLAAITSPTAAPTALPIRLRRSTPPASRIRCRRQSRRRASPLSARGGRRARGDAELQLRGAGRCVGDADARGLLLSAHRYRGWLRISPRAPLTTPDAASLQSMATDIREARAAAQRVVVALHKGIVHTPARLAPYERTVAQAAIDAGADVVVGHHAHILRGIEIHRGRPIFHGLGNGCVVTRALSPDGDDPSRAEWARRRQEIFGFTPDPAYHLAPFHPQAVNAMLGCVRLGSDGSVAAGFPSIACRSAGTPPRLHGR
jgi:poly-gamma-glutamate synthesis protein (capsule biosynthesis protein)